MADETKPVSINGAVLAIAGALNELLEELAKNGTVDGPRLHAKLMQLKTPALRDDRIANAVLDYVAQPLLGDANG